MKRILILLLACVLILTGCSSKDLLSNSFKSDLEQVLPIIEEAYKDDMVPEGEEDEILDSFNSKYNHGQYYVSKDEGYYEMNDLEKAIFNQATTMGNYVRMPKLNTSKLESEKDKFNYYKEAKGELDKLLKVKNLNNLPEEYKGKYPTYEMTGRVLPEQFEEDTKKLIELFDPIVNGFKNNITEEEWIPLENFYNQYNGDKEYGPYDYEQDGKYYLTNNYMKRAIIISRLLKEDIDEGQIKGDTINKFNEVKEDIKFLNP